LTPIPASTRIARAPAILLAALLLLIAFFIATRDLERESLWNDEGWSMWAVRDPLPADPGGGTLARLSQPARYVYSSLRTALERVREDVHPPLYFIALDLWTMLTGRSVYAARLLSALLALIGLAATYTLGRRLFDRQTAFIALVILGTAGFWVYYAREVRMYSLLLALSALSTWAYWRWSTRPTVRRGLLYGLSIAALLYTHYAGALVVGAQMVHWIVIFVVGIRHVTKGNAKPLSLRSLIRYVIPFILALILFTPWLPIIAAQMNAHGGRPLAARLLTDWSVVDGLILILTNGAWALMLLPFILGSAIPRLRQHGRSVLLLILWLLLTPLVLLALNAWVSPVYQLRYVIGILPAGALLVAYGLRYVGDFTAFAARGSKSYDRKYPVLSTGALYITPLQSIVVLILIIWIVYAQLAAYPNFWPGKPPWRESIQRVIQTRTAFEPAITDLAPYSVAAYYDEQLGLRQGIALDLSWREHTPQEMRDYVALMQDAPSVWTIQPTNTGKTWNTIAALSEGRGVGYRDSVANMIFYRFDRAADDALNFSFGDSLRYDGTINLRETVKQGERLCLDLPLAVLNDLDGSYSAGLHVIAGYNVLLAQWDQGLETPRTGDALDLNACMDIPAETPLGEHHLYLMIYKWHNPDERLPVIEHGEFYWGDVLVIGTLEVMSNE
jgi:hypothetical protein